MTVFTYVIFYILRSNIQGASEHGTLNEQIESYFVTTDETT